MILLNKEIMVIYHFSKETQNETKIIQINHNKKKCMCHWQYNLKRSLAIRVPYFHWIRQSFINISNTIEFKGDLVLTKNLDIA